MTALFLHGGPGFHARVEADTEAWLAAFPHAERRVVASGHMVHVETPPEVWFDPAVIPRG